MNYEACIAVMVLILVAFLLFLIVNAYFILKGQPGPTTNTNVPEHFNVDVIDNDQDNGVNDQDSYVDSHDGLIIGQKPRVLVVSCYGYGNMGDNMYAEVFTKYLPECEIVKVSDHSMFVNSQRQIVGKPPQKDYPFDFLIIGGGGLLTANKLKDSLNMPYYINKAKQGNKPLMIVSCGVQGSLFNFKYEFRLWRDALTYAKLITVRSTKDKELLGTIVDVNKIMYFRDLGYIFPHTMRHAKSPTKVITLIIAGPVHDKNETIRKYINDRKKDVVIMNMGSLKDDNNNKRMVTMDFPGINIRKYYGSGKAPELTTSESFMVDQQQMEKLLKSNPNLDKINPSDLTLQKVVSTILNSEIVFTGRYHGFIFSRSLGIPYDTLGMDTNKIQWEEPETTIEDMVLNSYNNIKMLRKTMNLTDTSSMDIFNLRNSINSL